MQQIYSSSAQRRWVWQNHPDVADALENREITPNTAVDIINARSGKKTHFSQFDFASNKVPVTKFANMIQKAKSVYERT